MSFGFAFLRVIPGDWECISVDLVLLKQTGESQDFKFVSCTNLICSEGVNNLLGASYQQYKFIFTKMLAVSRYLYTEIRVP